MRWRSNSVTIIHVATVISFLFCPSASYLRGAETPTIVDLFSSFFLKRAIMGGHIF